jgi:hypothetical protein
VDPVQSKKSWAPKGQVPSRRAATPEAPISALVAQRAPDLIGGECGVRSRSLRLLEY